MKKLNISLVLPYLTNIIIPEIAPPKVSISFMTNFIEFTKVINK